MTELTSKTSRPAGRHRRIRRNVLRPFVNRSRADESISFRARKERINEAVRALPGLHDFARG